MNVSLKYCAALIVAAFLIGMSLGHKSAPSRVSSETKTDTHLSDHSIIVRTKRPDGSVTTEIKKNVERVSESAVSKETERRQPQWLVSGIAGTSTDSFGSLLYGVEVQRRLGGPFFIGAQALRLNTGVFMGASLGVEF